MVKKLVIRHFGIPVGDCGRLLGLNIKYNFEKVQEKTETFIAFKTLHACALKGLLKIQNKIKRTVVSPPRQHYSVTVIYGLMVTC